MDFSEYIGFRFEDIKHILENSDLEYEVKEVWDRKKTKIGEDLRVVKTVNNDKIIIYVAFF